jgi:hypothetical protein
MNKQEILLCEFQQVWNIVNRMLLQNGEKLDNIASRCAEELCREWVRKDAGSVWK